MGALTGLKILDFSTLLPGPYATLVMADMGAEVVSVVAPDRVDLVTQWPPVIRESEGEDGKGITAAAAWLGRNKKSIFVNLKTPEGIEAIRRLVTPEEKGGGGFDIIMEQFRPGVMDRLGIGYEALSELNPALIFCSLTGYGQTGPMAMRAGHDINYMSRSGNMNQAGRKETGPVLTNMQVADVAVGSMNSVVSILAAVNYRNNTGEGQYLDVAMMDGMIPFNSMDGASWLGGGESPERETQLLNGGGIYDFYETADGRYMSVGSLEPKFFADLCKGLELDAKADKEQIRQRFREKTLSQWCEVFSRLDACVEPVLTMEEMREDEQVKAREMLPEVEIPGTEISVQQLGNPMKLSKCPVEYRHAGFPAGYNTDEVLVKLGFNEEEIQLIKK
ncbi:MAG: CaiB/BaiF CoA-transferase family protein [Bacillota bacterium]|nr:CaiB/BaiF CoA-transferase family protein [Bacillota bacterium]